MAMFVDGKAIVFVPNKSGAGKDFVEVEQTITSIYEVFISPILI